MARLEGKVALITGAGTGIGRATASAMAAQGAKVVVAEINAASGEQTAHIVTQAGGACIAVTTDVTQEDSVKAAIETAVRHFGGLHVLHNNRARRYWNVFDEAAQCRFIELCCCTVCRDCN